MHSAAMKHAVRLTILVMVVIAMSSLVPAAQDAPRQVFGFDTGVIKLGANQVLRVTLTSVPGFDDPWRWRKEVMAYSTSECRDGICKLALMSRDRSAFVSMRAGEAAVLDVPQMADAVRALIATDNVNVRVTLLIVDGITGEVVSVLVNNEVICCYKFE